MRRRTVQFPWISMMDLLFGLFGGLIIMAMIITLKLGSSSGIEARPYTLVTLSVARASAADTLVGDVLERMHLAFDVTSLGGADEHSCLFSVASDPMACEGFQNAVNDAPVRFSTRGQGTLAASLFIGAVNDELPYTRIRPALRDIAQLLDSSDYPRLKEEKVQIRLSVKFGEAYFEPVFDPISVAQLVQIANDSSHPGKDVGILPSGVFDCSAAQGTAKEACLRLKVDTDGFVFQ